MNSRESSESTFCVKPSRQYFEINTAQGLHCCVDNACGEVDVER